jgi:NitT/TauT family transport system permease protein
MFAFESNSTVGRRFGLPDVAAIAAVGAIIYGLIEIADEWGGRMQPMATIHLGLAHLPYYTLMSLTRGVAAYALSFFFTLLYGYMAARVKSAERAMVPLLDILQSIPVLGFLPGVVLALLHLFPHRNLGLELASVLMIFTGQVWNMTFSFYNSLKSVPEDLIAVTRLAGLSTWERFWKLELPYAANGLVWNSMMSMAGGWFFLSVSEAFVLKNQNFRLPGLGSYMAVAIEQGDVKSQVMGVLAMLLMIVFLDQIIWRPVVAWSQKFNEEDREATTHSGSWIWNWLRRSRFTATCVRAMREMERGSKNLKTKVSFPKERFSERTKRWVARAISAVLLGGVIFAVLRYVLYLTEVSATQWRELLLSTVATFARVLAAVVLGTLWAVPVGVAIGRNKRLAQRAQPIIQMAASFPAPMIYPLVLAILLAVGSGLGTGSVFLLLLGTQWYILFNVIAGASTIPPELMEVARLNQMSRSEQWKKLILPAIFPSLVTGWITAMGGAWNASIVAEYIKFKGQTLSTIGLGALISKATDAGEFALLAAAIGVMSFSVVAFNRVVWRRLSHLAQTRFVLC